MASTSSSRVASHERIAPHGDQTAALPPCPPSQTPPSFCNPLAGRAATPTCECRPVECQPVNAACERRPCTPPLNAICRPRLAASSPRAQTPTAPCGNRRGADASQRSCPRTAPFRAACARTTRRWRASLAASSARALRPTAPSPSLRRRPRRPRHLRPCRHHRRPPRLLFRRRSTAPTRAAASRATATATMAGRAPSSQSAPSERIAPIAAIVRRRRRARPRPRSTPSTVRSPTSR